MAAQQCLSQFGLESRNAAVPALIQLSRKLNMCSVLQHLFRPIPNRYHSSLISIVKLALFKIMGFGQVGKHNIAYSNRRAAEARAQPFDHEDFEVRPC